MDNAKIYRSPQLARIAASIGILIVHTPPYQPEGRGKIERFFRSSVVDNRRTVMWSLQLCGPGFPMSLALRFPTGTCAT
jgi:transposase InsO family protein